jgi:hypothetical protein
MEEFLKPLVREAFDHTISVSFGDTEVKARRSAAAVLNGPSNPKSYMLLRKNSAEGIVVFPLNPQSEAR